VLVDVGQQACSSIGGNHWTEARPYRLSSRATGRRFTYTTSATARLLSLTILCRSTTRPVEHAVIGYVPFSYASAKPCPRSHGPTS